ncbi:MAG TPA: SAM-dependent methyltransferase [Acidisarcina sp.]
MEENRPSATAQKVAIRRAAHQLLDDPLVFADPLAVRIIGPRASTTLLAAPEKFQTRSSRYLRALIAARSRFALDELALAVDRGVRQLVVLGAGLDTFAYQNPYPGLRVFEVDHPATQLWKRERLELVGIAAPESLTFAPVNFERETVEEGLLRAGYSAADPALFSWLGVTPYLTSETTLNTLRLIRALSPRNGVVFDFAVPPESLSGSRRAAFDELAARVASVGEPFVGFFDPAGLRQALEEIGFPSIQLLDAKAIDGRYFKGREDGLRVEGSVAHLVCATG